MPPIPPAIMRLALKYVVKTAPMVYNRAGKVIQKFATKKFGRYKVEIERRTTVGTDGGMSQVIRFLLHDATQEAWHIVVKAGRIIHRHRLQ